MKCPVHDKEVMGLKPGWVELRVNAPYVQIKPVMTYIFVYDTSYLLFRSYLIVMMMMMYDHCMITSCLYVSV